MAPGHRVGETRQRSWQRSPVPWYLLPQAATYSGRATAFVFLTRLHHLLLRSRKGRNLDQTRQLPTHSPARPEPYKCGPRGPGKHPVRRARREMRRRPGRKARRTPSHGSHRPQGPASLQSGRLPLPHRLYWADWETPLVLPTRQTRVIPSPPGVLHSGISSDTQTLTHEGLCCLGCVRQELQWGLRKLGDNARG